LQLVWYIFIVLVSSTPILCSRPWVFAFIEKLVIQISEILYTIFFKLVRFLVLKNFESSSCSVIDREEVFFFGRVEIAENIWLVKIIAYIENCALEHFQWCISLDIRWVGETFFECGNAICISQARKRRGILGKHNKL